MRFLLFVLIGVLFFSCGEEVVIKPRAELRLEYPEAEYEDLGMDLPFTFMKNKEAKLAKKRSKGFNLTYPKMNATLFVSYQPVNNGKNMDSLLYDAQKLAYDHTVKAESIFEQPRVDSIHKVYGMFYMINGNAATHSQFYVTDSLHHFLSGSVYFDTKPNYDSLYPAINYMRNDLRRIMETVEWK